jgi:uncharacterized protein (TIGR02145 family)
MKKLFYLIAAAALALGVSSCDPKEEAPKPSLEIVTTSPMQVGAEGGTFDIEIKSNTKRKVSGYSANISAVAPQSGEGDAKVSFTVASNFGGDARTETINFTIDDGGINPAKTFTIQQAKGELVYQGVTYRVARMKDGRVWMQENLRYIPEGKTVSGDLANNTGVWYPVTFWDANASDLDPSVTKVEFMTGDADVAKYGLLYNFATASGKDLSQIDIPEPVEKINNEGTEDEYTSYTYTLTAEQKAQWEKTQGICPNGWYIPTEAEWVAFIAAYPYTPAEGATTPNQPAVGLPNMVDIGFLAGPFGSVMMSNSSATPALNKLGYIFSSTVSKYSRSNSNATTSYTNIMMRALMQSKTYDSSTEAIKNNYYQVADGSVYTAMPVRCIKAE